MTDQGAPSGDWWAQRGLKAPTARPPSHLRAHPLAESHQTPVWHSWGAGQSRSSSAGPRQAGPGQACLVALGRRGGAGSSGPSAKQASFPRAAPPAQPHRPSRHWGPWAGAAGKLLLAPATHCPRVTHPAQTLRHFDFHMSKCHPRQVTAIQGLYPFSNFLGEKKSQKEAAPYPLPPRNGWAVPTCLSPLRDASPGSPRLPWSKLQSETAGLQKV